MARLTGPRQRSISESTSFSNFARLILICRCLGPWASAVINGRLISVDWAELSSFLAFSHASWRRCRAIVSFRRSIPCSFWNSSAT